MIPGGSASAHVAPAGAVLATALLVFIVGLLARRPSRWLPALSSLGLAVALVLKATDAAPRGSIFSGMIVFDGFGHLASLTLLAAALAVAVASGSWAARERGGSDFYVLLLFSVLGGLLLAHAGDLVVLFLGVEATSIPLYALVAFQQRGRQQAAEGALKYFLLGAFAAAVMVFGMSLLFAAAGTTQIAELAAGLAGMGGPYFTALLATALVLTGVGLAFKLGAAPFHFWVPDAYEASTPAVAGVLATLPKVAALAVVVRLLGALGAYSFVWGPGVVLLALASMAVGNLGGLRQRSVARLLGYSSVAQMGYVLVGLAVGTTASLSAGMTYFSVYAAAALGAFLAVSMLRADDAGSLDDMAGLARRHPALGIALGLFLLSLVGIPPLAGFFGKLVLFKAAIDSGMTWLAVTGLLFSVVSLGYYGAILREAFLNDAEAGERRGSSSAGLAVAALSLVVVLIALAPGYVFVTLQ